MDLNLRRPISRRKFFAWLGGAAAVAAGTGAYTHWGEPHWLEVTRRSVPLGRGQSGAPLRVLHLSDLHASSVVSLEYLAHAIALGLATKPDLIVLTGDFITARYEQLAPYAEVLRPLAAAAPTFAVFGNHDGGRWAARTTGYRTLAEAQSLLRDAHITVLENEARALRISGRDIQLIGVGDLWAQACDPDAAFARTPPRGEAIRVLLNHNPDAKDLLRPFDWDIMLCGHTHGGQLRLPFLGTPFAPVVDKRYVQGLHRWDNRWLFVTRGVGNLHGVRFNCRPEISLLELA